MKIMVTAGEISGDIHAADLIRALKRIYPRAEFVGTGGDAMRAEGVRLFYHTEELATMGIWEVLVKLSFFRRILADLKRRLAAEKPDLFISVDYPGMNIRLAAAAKRLGIPTIHYISPKVWVWKRNRIFTIAKVVDLLLCIFPFEPGCYAPAGFRPVFVGNPLVAQLRTVSAGDGLWRGTPRIALLPGSRRLEIANLMPVLLETAALLRERFPNASFVIPAPSAGVRKLLDVYAIPDYVRVVEGCARETMKGADAGVIASGTATLEATLLGCPAVLIYKMSLATELFAKAIIRNPVAGLTNLIAGREVIPELLQRDCNPANIVRRLLPLLQDSCERREMLAGYETVRKELGESDAAVRAANEIQRLLER